MRIQVYTSSRITNEHPDGPVSKTRWMNVRNALVKACRRHGGVGPLGHFRFWLHMIINDFLKAWHDGDDDPTYYIATDQYDGERYHYVEVLKPESFTTGWIADVQQAHNRFDGWGVGIGNIDGGYMLIFAKKLMVSGSIAEAAGDLDDLIALTQQNLAN